MANRLCVGMGIGKCENIVSIVDQSPVIEEFGVPNNLPGSKTISSKITAAMQKNSCDSLAIGLEAASVYGETLAHTLKETCSALDVPRGFSSSLDIINTFNAQIKTLGKYIERQSALVPQLLLSINGGSARYTLQASSSGLVIFIVSRITPPCQMCGSLLDPAPAGQLPGRECKAD